MNVQSGVECADENLIFIPDETTLEALSAETGATFVQDKANADDTGIYGCVATL
jgi:hypothetical protein